jgi:predicted ATPase
MRIKELKLNHFKNLRDFEIHFDSGPITTVLLGQNGTGKSNLLEALVIIFRDLDLGELPTIDYSILYECRGNEVRIASNRRNDTSQIQITVDGQPVSYASFCNDSERKFLPSNVFGYYSGPSSRFEAHFAKHQDKFYRQLLANTPGTALRSLFYARLIHSQFVLLAFFYEQDEQCADFLRRYLGIEQLESVLFVLKTPPWSRKEGDPRFWGARGAVRDFLDRLYRYALAPIKLKQRIDLGFRKFVTQDRLYLFLKDRSALEQLGTDYVTSGEFFKALESTYLSNLLAEVRIRIKMPDQPAALTFRELSEGEQQLLTVLGLLRFTRDDEALFLLDEPDTHLNPLWSLHYLELVKEVVGEQKTSQIIMATHDPLTIGGLTRQEVRVMYKDPATRSISARVPSHDPKGMGVSGILTSDLFGLRSDLDPKTLCSLDEQRDLEVKMDLTEEDKQRLAELRKELKDVDISARVRDPLFRDFVKAMVSEGAYQEVQDLVLTPDQKKRREELASKALREVQGLKVTNR